MLLRYRLWRLSLLFRDPPFKVDSTLCVIWILGVLSIFTFYIPLFLSSIPKLKHKYSIYSIDPSNIDVSLQFGVNNMSFSCATSDTELSELYTAHGICFPPSQFEGMCNGTLVAVYLTNLTYGSYVDEGTSKDFPEPFIVAKKNDLCGQQWIFDPVSDVFVSNSREYCLSNGKYGHTVENYVRCQDFDASIALVVLLGGLLGLLPLASLLCVVHLVYLAFITLKGLYVEYLL